MATKSEILQKILDTLDGLSSTATLDIAKIWAMLGYAYKELKAVSFSGDANLYFGVDAGSTDAYAISVTGYTAYVNGDTFIFVANTDNTEAASLNVTTIGAKTLKKSFNQNLETGDILAGQIVIASYDGANDCFQLLGGNSAELTEHIANTTDAHGIDDLATAANLSSHEGNKSNPHSVTKTQVGLGNVADAAQIPLSTITEKAQIIIGTGNGTITVISSVTDGETLVVDTTTASGYKFAKASSSQPHPFLF